jgi:hypothetical protein
MTVKAECFVLREDEHAPQIGIDAVGQGDVNDAV